MRLVLFALLFSASLLFAGPNGIPPAWTSYSERPEATDNHVIRPTEHKDAAKDKYFSQENFLRANLEAAAQVASFQEFTPVFVARGPEYVADMYQLMASPAEKKRAISVNVSRNLSSSDKGNNPRLREYLEQQGITEERLKNGEKFLIVDNGWYGNMSRRMASLFPGHEEQFKTLYLGLSWDKTVPQSRLFHTALTPDANEIIPQQRQHIVTRYDNQPRWTARAENLVRNTETGKLEPVAPKGGKSQPRVSPERAKKIMETQAFYARQADALALWAERKALYKEMNALTATKNKSKIIAGLEKILERSPNNPYIHAIVYDYIQTLERTHSALGIRIRPGEINLKGIPLPQVIHPAAITGGARTTEPKVAQLIRLAAGQVAGADELSKQDIIKVRKGALSNLIENHFKDPLARQAIASYFLDAEPDIVNHLANAFSVRHLDDPEILRSAAAALVDPNNLTDDIVRERLLGIIQKQTGAAKDDAILEVGLGLERILLGSELHTLKPGTTAYAIAKLTEQKAMRLYETVGLGPCPKARLIAERQ